MPPRQAQDPFTDAPLRPNNNAPLRAQQGMRPTASTASARPRQQRDLFAPALSRRPTSRSTPRVEDEVLADPDSEEEMAGQRQKHIRRIRQGSPEGKYSRLKPQQEEEPDIVNRQPDGSYLLDVSASNEAITQHMFAPELQAARDAAGRLRSSVRQKDDKADVERRYRRRRRRNGTCLLHVWCCFRQSRKQEARTR